MHHNNTSLVFVYGSLRLDEDNHHYLASSELLNKYCYTEGRLFDTGHGYPAMIPFRRERVYGELYSITSDILARLDELEEYYGEGKDNDYERVIQTIYTDIGEYKAYVYVYQPARAEGLIWIKSGDWKIYLSIQ